MKSSHPADAHSSPTHYAPSVPMTVYRELAAELRANKAVIDSLNSRNQQLLQQNQLLKQEIHNVVQATLNLGQVAGVARQSTSEGSGLSREFPSAIAPDTLAKLVRGETNSSAELLYAPPYAAQSAESPQQAALSYAPPSPSAATASNRNRVPREIASKSASKPAKQKSTSEARSALREANKNTPKPQSNKQRPPAFRPGSTVSTTGAMSQSVNQKLFTEQSGEYRSSALDASENKEIGGIWLVLSIILIIVTAFGAGFLIMKPLLNDR